MDKPSTPARDGRTTGVFYHAVGSVRGSCGHNHDSIRAAQACVNKDQLGCRKAGGYSDRKVARTDGYRLSANEIERVHAAMADLR